MKRFRTKDPVESKLRRLYNRSCCQARYKNQQWHIEWEDYLALWLKDDRYLQIGTGANSLNLCRKNQNKDWTIDNVSVQPRGNNCRRKFGDRYAT